MTATVARNLKPDDSEGEEWPALFPVPPETTPEERDSFDPTQGRKIGSDPYDDPTRAH